MHSFNDNTKWRLHPAYAIVEMPIGVQLRAGDEEILVLEGNAPTDMKRFLEQLREPFAMAELTIAPELSEQAEAILQQLQQAQLLIPATVDTSLAVRYWTHGTASPIAPQVALGITGNSPLVQVLAQLAHEHDFQVQQLAEASTSAVSNLQLLMHAWEQPQLAEVLQWNQLAVRERIPQLFVDLSHGRHATLGPFYVPGEGACYECYRQRWRSNAASLPEMDAAQQAMLSTQQPLPAYGTLPAFRAWLAGMAVTELEAWRRGQRGLRTLNRAITLDFESLDCHSEPVWRVPWCTVCGAAT